MKYTNLLVILELIAYTTHKVCLCASRRVSCSARECIQRVARVNDSAFPRIDRGNYVSSIVCLELR